MTSLLYALILSMMLPLSAEPTTGLDDDEALRFAVDAYIYGYPLVTMDQTRRVMTNVKEPTSRHAPMGQFAHAKSYPDAAFHDVTAPNADTLYSVAWLNLTDEPYILHVPPDTGRYWLMPLLSGWTDVFSDLGTRTTGSKGGDYAIVGPFWKGTLPHGVKELKSPSNLVWILGRTYSTGTKEDDEKVHAIQNQYTLTPLRFYKKSYTPPEGIVDPSVDMVTPVREQVNRLDGIGYFNRLVALMKENPPTRADASVVAKMALLGLIAGQSFTEASLPATIAAAIDKAPRIALEKIEKVHSRRENGWNILLKTGRYGTDYLERAQVAFFGLGANLPQDAVYPYTHVDAAGNQLTGANGYVLHFAKGRTPPARGFWSLTMYNSDFYFVDNPLKRYTLSPRDTLELNPDGSLDLFIQHASPGSDHKSNWLPAPEGDFVLMLRIYWPEESLLDGSWRPPAVKKVNREG